jgi:flagellar biogenesis protein FliO
MDLITYLTGFLIGAALALILVAIWELRKCGRSLKNYEQ